MNCKKRNTSIESGVPGAYFLAHPDDMKYLDEIAEDVLKLCDCAIYYGDLCDEDEVKLAIDFVQFVIVPVTAQFIGTQNCAKGVLEYALNNKPVLFLLKGENVDLKEFNEISDERQYIDKNDRSDAAFPYERKLQSFLDSVIIGEELKKRIWDKEFAARIFLSYRKKDRRNVAAIVKRIQKYDFARDVGVWFDEYLESGEKFNDVIRKEIDKASVFLLSVTKNIFEEGNYVLTEEYPRAERNRKEIVDRKYSVLPVYTKEYPVDEEDIQTFREMYSDEIYPIDVDNATEFENRLRDALSDIINCEINTSSEHEYYIGLAYLKGIYTVANSEIAEKFIKKAAYKGNFEAMKKLAEMYEYGDGIVRSIDESLKWYFKLARESKNRFESGDDEWKFDKALYDMVLYANKLYQYGRFGRAEEIFSGLCSNLELLMNSMLSNNAIDAAKKYGMEFVAIKSRQGDCFLKLGDEAKKAECYKEAEDTAERFKNISRSFYELFVSAENLYRNASLEKNFNSKISKLDECIGIVKELLGAEEVTGDNSNYKMVMALYADAFILKAYMKANNVLANDIKDERQREDAKSCLTAALEYVEFLQNEQEKNRDYILMLLSQIR